MHNTYSVHDYGGILEMNQYTDLEIELCRKLVSIKPDKDFVKGVMCYLETDEERQFVIDYIDKGEDVSTTQINLLSLDIELERRKKNIEKVL